MDLKFLLNSQLSFTSLRHSHKRQEDCLETRFVFIEIFMLSRNSPNRPKHRGLLTGEKIWLSLKRTSYLQMIFILLWIAWTMVCFHLQRNWAGNGLSNIKDALAESFQLQVPVLHQSMCIFKAGLSSVSDDWVKYKEKVPDVTDSNKNLETTCNSKLKFRELENLFIKRVQKIYPKMNFVCS